jgi:hypothetical protein
MLLNWHLKETFFKVAAELAKKWAGQRSENPYPQLDAMKTADVAHTKQSSRGLQT